MMERAADIIARSSQDRIADRRCAAAMEYLLDARLPRLAEYTEDGVPRAGSLVAYVEHSELWFSGSMLEAGSSTASCLAGRQHHRFF